MKIPGWIRELFLSIDRKDAAEFASFLSESARFRYGSQAVVEGKEAIRKYVAGFFLGLAALEHHVHSYWDIEGGKYCFVGGDVTYTLKDGRRVTLPFLNLFQMSGPQIQEYLVYTDPTPMTSS